MNDRVLPATKEVFKKIFKNAETFEGSALANQELENLTQRLGRHLTDTELKSTLMYRENMNWLKEKLAQGYNVIDIGPKTPHQVKSTFYLMERSLIYTR